ncbi:peptidase M48 [Helicobacter bilis]|uniref:Peptidase M48 n=1 Tax=Helicobacter bilis TaxID=37372 RepID=A0A1Q2LIZ1_9HELI|nr:peptidase M48 [Helicobacter bilis]
MYLVILAYLLLFVTPAIVLNILQMRYIQTYATKKPVILNAHDYSIAASYAITRCRVALIEHIFSFIALVFWLFFGVTYLTQFYNMLPISGFGANLLVILSFLGLHALIHIPFSIAQKRIDSHYGFNKQSVKGFVLDGIKMFVVSGILLGIIFALLLWIMESLSSWWLVGFCVVFAFLVFIQLVYPTLIAPMFNKFTPLDNELLRQRITTLMEHAGFHSSGIFVIDASRRDGRLNAYFGGLGSMKRVVLFDTLLDKISEDGLIAILGHELGHFKHGDITQNIIISGSILFAMFAIMGLFFEPLCLYLGLPFTDSSILILAILLFPVLSFLFMPIQSYFSRKAEYRADAFGASCVSKKALSEALVRLVNENKAFPYSHPAYIFFYYSHPPLLERLKALGGLHDGN